MNMPKTVFQSWPLFACSTDQLKVPEDERVWEPVIFWNLSDETLSDGSQYYVPVTPNGPIYNYLITAQVPAGIIQ